MFFRTSDLYAFMPLKAFCLKWKYKIHWSVMQAQKEIWWNIKLTVYAIIQGFVILFMVTWLIGTSILNVMYLKWLTLQKLNDVECSKKMIVQSYLCKILLSGASIIY